METKSFKDMDIKSKFAIVTAMVAFIAGWGVTVWGFYLPPRGEVHDSVLWILGQALIYTASVLGIGMYFNNEIARLRRDTQRYIREAEKGNRDEIQEGGDETE